MTAAAAFRATYSDWRLIKGRKVVQIVFELPLELSGSAYDALGGMPNPAAEVWCGIARLNPNAAGTDATAGEAVKPLPGLVSPSIRKPVAPEKRLAQRAGILCADPIFHRFLQEKGDCQDCTEELATAYVRLICGVGSRADIIPGTPAADKFDKLYSDFMVWRDHPELVAS